MATSPAIRSRAVALIVMVVLAPWAAAVLFRYVPGLWFLGAFVSHLLVSVIVSVGAAFVMVRRGIGYQRVDAWLVLVPYVGLYFLGKFVWRGVHARAGERYWVEPGRPGGSVAG